MSFYTCSLAAIQIKVLGTHLTIANLVTIIRAQLQRPYIIIHISCDNASRMSATIEMDERLSAVELNLEGCAGHLIHTGQYRNS